MQMQLKRLKPPITQVTKCADSLNGLGKTLTLKHEFKRIKKKEKKEKENTHKPCMARVF